MAADIESLIRQALARQNGFDPQVRSRIYQSSRNALAKMIAKRGMVPPDVIESRNRSLEETIERIELEFTASVPRGPEVSTEISVNDAPVADAQIAPPPSSVSIPQALDPSEATPPNRPLGGADTISPQFSEELQDPGFTNASRPVAHQTDHSGFVDSDQHFPGGVGSTVPQPAPQLQVDVNNPDQYSEPTPQIAQPRRKIITYIIWLIGLSLILVTGWIAYAITTEFLAVTSPNPNPGKSSENIAENNTGNFITILDPSQPDALVTAGHGTAEILNDITQPAIRITSVRSAAKLGTQAEPILLKLAPGILKNIAGKKVTVEILAKSGGTGAATFSIACHFGNLGECGRKRFRIGLQPEAVIFSILISPDYKDGQTASLAINTDVTSAAAQSGKGAAIDIIYARIRN